MIRGTTAPLRSAATLHAHAKRWVSYDKASLTREAILKRVESGLGEDVHGNPLRINVEEKTLSTAAGSLPISPLLDPLWIQRRRRQRKERPQRWGGRFSKMLNRNPYAWALATPLRRCTNTNVTLPRYFLQEFELVRHPTSSVPWWAPGPLSFDDLRERPTTSRSIDEPKRTQSDPDLSPLWRVDGSVSTEKTVPSSANDNQDATTFRTQQRPEGVFSSSADAHLAAGSQESTEKSLEDDPQPSERRHRGPLTVYMSSRKSLVDLIGKKSKNAALLARGRTGLAAYSISQQGRSPVWRSDMGDVLLAMLRRRAVDALIDRGRDCLNRYVIHQSIFHCASWDDVRRVERRGCVLWLPQNKQAAQQYATLDIEDVHYDTKMAVHNLYWLLGHDEVRRLQHESEVFRKGKIFVLTVHSSMSMMKLHLLLWRLQGYLDQESADSGEEAEFQMIKKGTEGAAQSEKSTS
ncbi:Esterase-like protein [Ophiocordyceps camponoti-floridani]|uniref:Esterase-like protein n=1 Tax=Ophiocordyceps camponoti-floridani TaxID=2030778 RepID=A0A8H4Q7N1_9HYPO|nr:Esterase-like protein [Ophiocordyceps camponoti-floridani]